MVAGEGQRSDSSKLVNTRASSYLGRQTGIYPTSIIPTYFTATPLLLLTDKYLAVLPT